MKKFLFDTWYGALVAWWGAAIVFLAFLAAEVMLPLVRLPTLLAGIIGIILFALLGVASAVGIVVWLKFLFARRWRWALGQFFLGLASLAVFGGAFFFLCLIALLGGPSEDHFADKLAIPPDVTAQLVVPLDVCNDFNPTADVYEDDFAKAVFANESDDEAVTCDLSALSELVRERRAELMAYLAKHPGWWLHEDQGHLFATRRLRADGVWHHTLSGCYVGNRRTRKDDEKFESRQGFQMWTTIGFAPFVKWKSPAHPVVGTFTPTCKSECQDEKTSCVLVGDTDFCVEIFEQASTSARRITNGALAFLKREFETLALPADAATDADEFVFRNGTQPGIYNLTMRINPGEPGLTYLKAYEVTKGTRLSERRIRNRSNERVGWSDNPREKFLYENEFTIYEGDWGKPYAARIEVWFKPDSGKPERKLLERLCKVEGWQR